MRYALLFLFACSHTDPVPVIAPPGPVPSSVPSAAASIVVTKPAAPCAIKVDAPVAFSIPTRLQAIAPQYFHVTSRDDGFNDLVPGTNRYRWYDPSDLATPVDPPGDMTMIGRSTAHWVLGHAADWTFRVARKTDTKTTVIPGPALHEIDAVEDPSGGLWITAGNLSSLAVPMTRVIHIDASMKIEDWTIATSPMDPWDRRIGITADGKVAFVWVASASGVALMAEWLGPSGWGPPVMLDNVSLPPDAEDLSLRTTTNLRIAQEGKDQIAIGWRPLTPKPGEIDPPGPPPVKSATAQNRLLVVHPTTNVVSKAAYSTRAVPLGGTSGVGPWPLAGNGMAAGTYAGHAVFFWNEDGNAFWTTIGGVPKTLAPGAFRLVPRASDVLLLRSVGTQQQAILGCL